MPAPSATAVLRASARLEARAGRLLARMDSASSTEASFKLDEAAGLLYEKIAVLDAAIVNTPGTLDDGITKINMAMGMAAPDNQQEVWFEILRSGIADVIANRSPPSLRRDSGQTK